MSGPKNRYTDEDGFEEDDFDGSDHDDACFDCDEEGEDDDWLDDDDEEADGYGQWDDSFSSEDE